MFYGNASTVAKLRKSIMNGKSCLITGPTGVGKMTATMEILKDYLQQNPISHCDFMYITDSKESVKVDDIRPVCSAANAFPLKAQKRVFLFDCQQLSNVVQDKLLKLVEEGQASNMFLFVTPQPLLNTLKSRLETHVFHPISDKEMSNYLEYMNVPNVEFWTSLCGGSIGRFCELNDSNELISFFHALLKYFEDGSYATYSFLKLHHSYKEQDKENFFELHKDFLPIYFHLLNVIFQALYLKRNGLKESSLLDFSNLMKLPSENVLSIMALIDSEILHSSSVMYGKNDFFDFLVSFSKLLKI